MSHKYSKGSDIRQMANRKPVIKQLEYTSESDYLMAQKKLHDYVFSQPAKNCTLCGYPMDYQGHQPCEWEKKWSTHQICKDKMHKMLDRETGITRERRAFGFGKNRHRYR